LAVGPTFPVIDSAGIVASAIIRRAIVSAVPGGAVIAVVTVRGVAAAGDGMGTVEAAADASVPRVAVKSVRTAAISVTVRICPGFAALAGDVLLVAGLRAVQDAGFGGAGEGGEGSGRTKDDKRFA
jgi:hypothetical protein